MKAKLLFLFLICSRFVHAQDWVTIKKDAITYFASDTNNIHPIRIDSIATDGDNTILKSFAMIRPVDQSSWDYTLHGDSWIGEKVVIQPDGYNTFYNKVKRPIEINTLALVSETWVMYIYPDNSYIEAKVTDEDVLTFLGITDTVKTISIQMKNSNGTLITSTNPQDSAFIINNAQLKLSQHYGFIQIFDFYNFPSTQYDFFDMYYSSFSYSIVGISNPAAGYNNISAKELFDFSVGDEVHTNQYSYSGFMPVSSSSNSMIEKYLSKTQSLNLDTVTYQVERCIRAENYYGEDTTISTTHDTIIKKYNLSEDVYKKFSALPLEPFENGGLHSFSYSSLYQKNICNDYLFNYDSEQDILHQVFPDPVYCEKYYMQIGGPYYEAGMFMDYYGKNLVYYKKGDYEWGVPYSCDILLGVREKLLGKYYFTISPNPTNDNLLMVNSNNSKSSRVNIVDINGRLMYKSEFKGNHTIDVSSYPKGVYVVKITGEQFDQVQKVIVY